MSQRRKWRQGGLSQLSNVSKLVAMEKEIGSKFPGFTVLNCDKHQVHGGWENKEPTSTAMEVLWYVFSGASGKAQHSKNHMSLPPPCTPVPAPSPRQSGFTVSPIASPSFDKALKAQAWLWMSLCANAPESWIRLLVTIASDPSSPSQCHLVARSVSQPQHNWAGSFFAMRQSWALQDVQQHLQLLRTRCRELLPSPYPPSHNNKKYLQTLPYLLGGGTKLSLLENLWTRWL